MSNNGGNNGGSLGQERGKGPSQPTRDVAMNPNNPAYNPSAADAKGGNPSADRAAAFNPQHQAFNPTSRKD
ncbi:uncharacterized protein UTRI_00256 [Ustilago trichophora]|uniref:Uncharacterized protein n=1 Tax=Ustilago trichophora TaxID=86804 RepID=A0A5C3DUT6_9BASI|nr:uncharacterized protein UTRI_00256 [Ustilago trichophora]